MQFRAGYHVDGHLEPIVAEVRFDDACHNGHNTFAITGTIFREGKLVSTGCIHEEIAKYLPHLAKYLKWHLCSTDGPLHYIANTVYHAGDKDCWGMRKGEFRQFYKDGQPQYTLPHRDTVAGDKPAPVEWEMWGRTGEGKERDLDAARRSAIWPDATDEELTAPGLKERLEARLPALMIEFKKAMEELGFKYQ